MESKLIGLIDLELLKARPAEDYLQLFFAEETILNVYNVYRFEGERRSLQPGEQVVGVSESPEKVSLSFSSGSRLIIGLQDDDYRGPEALELIRKGEGPVVWR